MTTFESNSKEEVYYDRNQAVLLAFMLAHELGFTVGIKPDDAWPIFYIDLPESGQVSWHIPIDDVPVDVLIPAYQDEWDGHSSGMKRHRIYDFLSSFEEPE